MNREFSTDKIVNNLIVVVALSMVVFQFISARVMFMQPMKMVVAHGGFALLIVFLDQLRKTKKTASLFYLLMLVLSVVSVGFILINYQNLIGTKGLISRTEVIMGILLFIVFWEASRLSCGWTIPILTLIFLLYAFYGHYLPQPFWHIPMRLEYIVSFAGIGLVDGIFGKTMTISANFVFLFLLFGVLLQVTGADNFFMEVAKIPGKWMAGGPAMTAVMSSALVGTVTGSGQANVAITGPFTIPLMRKVGYSAAQAGGIESAASTGGSIMPPVMGIVAFVMAQFTGTPYVRLISMAIIPAILYYMCIAIYVHLYAGKLKIEKVDFEIEIKKIIFGAPLFLIPIAVLLWLLVAGYSLRFTVFYMVSSIVLVAMLRKETRGTLSHWIKGLTKGAILGSQIAVIMGLIGAMISFIDLTGLLIKFPGIVVTLSNGNLYIMLLLVAIVSIILGCALPPFASYLLVAMLVAPALIQGGLLEMQAHFFIYFYAVFALITPPVGLACVVAAPLCGASYLSTSWEAVKAGVVAWFLPIMVVGAPVIILLPSGDITIWLPKLFSCFFMVVMLQVTVVGYYLRETTALERLLSAFASLTFVVFILNSNYLIFAAGLAAGVFVTLKQVAARTRARNAEMASHS